jgi:putative oxidoreductase
MNQVSFGLLVLRVVFGVFMAVHGYNKVFRGGKLAGTAAWFGSIGMKWPVWQARMAAATEIGGGVLFAAGLATPLAAAALISLMLVAIVVTHLKNGFFIFNKDGGWEYCASIATVAFAVGTIGAGKYSIDHLLHKDVSGWTGAIITGVVGVVGAATHLGLSYRKPAGS